MAQEVGAGKVGFVSLDNQGLFGPWAASRPHNAGRAESLPYDRGAEEEPEERAQKDEEEDHLAIVSKYDTIPSNESPSPLFFVFGRPLIFEGSSSWVDCCDSERAMEPLRMVTVDGREWEVVQDDTIIEVAQETMGIGFPRGDPVNAVPDCLGYEKWEDSFLVKFSEFLEVSTMGYENETLGFMRKMVNQ